MTDEQKLAEFLRTVVNRSVVPADDVTQQNLALGKRWLDAIAAGTLIVTVAPAPSNEAPPGANPASP